MRTQTVASAGQLRQMSTAELRASFLAENLFKPGAIELVSTDLDRAVLGSAVPLDRSLVLAAPPELRASYFTERREIGVLNLGAPGAVTVDGKRHALSNQDALYIGRGSRQVEFASEQPSAPARFYLVSYPAHSSHPTRHADFADAEPQKLGNGRDANQRTIYKYIHPAGIASCQLVMGITRLQEGSVWNTMPPHTHARRSEIYLYFDVPPGACVMHFMGEPAETRHLVVRNEQAVLSPPWSIHCGAGTCNYSFAWAMGGENQEFADMDALGVRDLA